MDDVLFRFLFFSYTVVDDDDDKTTMTAPFTAADSGHAPVRGEPRPAAREGTGKKKRTDSKTRHVIIIIRVRIFKRVRARALPSRTKRRQRRRRGMVTLPQPCLWSIVAAARVPPVGRWISTIRAEGVFDGDDNVFYFCSYYDDTLRYIVRVSVYAAAAVEYYYFYILLNKILLLSSSFVRMRRQCPGRCFSRPCDRNGYYSSIPFMFFFFLI